MPFRWIVREFLSTGLLSISIIGSAVFAENLTEDFGIRLLINMLATVLMIFILIAINTKESQVDFNPIVTLLRVVNSEMSKRHAGSRICFQLLGAICGAGVVNLMFGNDLITVSNVSRIGFPIALGEMIATLGLLVISKSNHKSMGLIIPAWIGSAFFFTSSTAFANPAITIGRIFTDSFSGVSFYSVPYLIFGQVVALSLVVMRDKLKESS